MFRIRGTISRLGTRLHRAAPLFRVLCAECTVYGHRYYSSVTELDTGDRRVVGNFVREYLVGECTALLASGSKPTTRKAASCSTENSEV